jgi:hypothetical protein
MVLQSGVSGSLIKSAGMATEQQSGGQAGDRCRSIEAPVRRWTYRVDFDRIPTWISCIDWLVRMSSGLPPPLRR